LKILAKHVQKYSGKESEKLAGRDAYYRLNLSEKQVMSKFFNDVL